MPTNKKCRYCKAELDKDTVGLNKKLFDRETRCGLFMCLLCMSEFCECSVEELEWKIEDFKAAGCILFS